MGYMRVFIVKNISGVLARRAGKGLHFRGFSMADLVAGQGEEILDGREGWVECHTQPPGKAGQ